MKYLLTKYDINRFHMLNDLVRLCYFNPMNMWGSPQNRLAQVGTTRNGLSESNINYIESNSDPVDVLNGVCFHGNNDFKVWINPDIKAGSLLFELTLLHELCHGYIGPIMHGRVWRRYFGRALIFYGKLVNPEFHDAEWQLKHTVRRYWGEENPEAPYNTLVAQSHDELETVVYDVEKNLQRFERDYTQLQEMRESCRKSSSNTTQTPDYLALQLKKAGMASRLT